MENICPYCCATDKKSKREWVNKEKVQNISCNICNYIMRCLGCLRRLLEMVSLQVCKGFLDKSKGIVLGLPIMLEVVYTKDVQPAAHFEFECCPPENW